MPDHLVDDALCWWRRKRVTSHPGQAAGGSCTHVLLKVKVDTLGNLADVFILLQNLCARG